MCQMEPHVKWHFFGRKVIFSVSNVPERFKEPIFRFSAKEISVSQIFKTCSDLINIGRVCSVLMALVTLQSLVTIGCLRVGYMRNSKIKMANLIDEKGEFPFAIFRHPPPRPLPQFACFLTQLYGSNKIMNNSDSILRC